MKLLSRKHEARARNMVKRGKRLSASAERSSSLGEEGARYRKANALFSRAYSWLRFKGTR